MELKYTFGDIDTYDCFANIRIQPSNLHVEITATIHPGTLMPSAREDSLDLNIDSELFTALPSVPIWRKASGTMENFCIIQQPLV